MKLLTFTTLYPNAIQTRHGIFVEQRIRHLLQMGEVEARVVAPVPWFPFDHPIFGKYAEFARVPRTEWRHGVLVDHPPYPVIPKVGMSVAPILLYRAAKGALRKLLREGLEFDLIDSHYFYPDGIAASLLGHWLDKPVVITARGNDLSLLTRHAIPRAMIVAAARRAAGLVTVCQALKDRLVELGIAEEAVRVLRNGVDLELFRPIDPQEARRKVGVSGRVLVSVGHLIERKGNHLTIQALERLPNTTLLVIGDGPERRSLEQLAHRKRVGHRVRFLGPMAQPELTTYYSAADALVLASSREGWANVLLEAMACGTPVVATSVWGTPEVVAAPEAGVLVEERTHRALARGIERLFARYPDRSATRRYAENYDWTATSRGQLELFNSILERDRRRQR